MSAGPGSRMLAEALARVESPGVTSFDDGWPVFWESAQGWTVTDVDGKAYLDMTSAFGVASVGHANPRVVNAVAKQAGQLMHGMGDVHPPRVKVEALQAIARIAPAGMGHAHLGLNGADAVETALKCVELVTGRPGVIAFEGAYHGLAAGALGATARRDFRDPFMGRLGGHTTFVPFPEAPGEEARVLETIERKLSRRGAGLPPTGGIIVEPIQGRGGVVVPPPGFLAGLRELCDRFDLLLIADEIFTGMGRTGRWFACEYDGVIPDLLCLGKALGGGMPISVCIGNDRSMGQWPKATGEALHTATFLGHPVSCAAVIAAIAEIEEQGLPERAAAMGAHLRERFLAADLCVRGRGLMQGVVLESGEAAWDVVTGALERGVLLLPSGERGQVISLTPPLTIEQGALDEALDVIIELCR